MSTTTNLAPNLDTVFAAYEAGHAMADDGWSRLLARQAVGAAERGELSWSLILAARARNVIDRLDEDAYRAFRAALEAVVPTRP